MFCSTCGKPTDVNANFCKWCGSSVTDGSQLDSSAENLKATTVEPAIETFPIEEGTPVVLRFTETISSQTAAIGDRINLVLHQDLRVGEHIVAERGAKAVASVSHVKKAGMVGKGAELNVRLEHIKAGQHRIPVRSQQAVQGDSRSAVNIAMWTFVWGAFALMKRGEHIEIPAGTVITGYLDDDMKLPGVKAENTERKFCVRCTYELEQYETGCPMCGQNQSRAVNAKPRGYVAPTCRQMVMWCVIGVLLAALLFTLITLHHSW